MPGFAWYDWALASACLLREHNNYCDAHSSTCKCKSKYCCAVIDMYILSNHGQHSTRTSAASCNWWFKFLWVTSHPIATTPPIATAPSLAEKMASSLDVIGASPTINANAKLYMSMWRYVSANVAKNFHPGILEQQSRRNTEISLWMPRTTSQQVTTEHLWSV